MRSRKYIISITYKGLSVKYLLIFFLILNTYFLILNTGVALAANASNSNYDLQIQDIDTPKEKITQPPQDTPKITPAPKLEMIRETAPLVFSLSTTLIDFGNLSPTSPSKRESTLSVLSTNIGYTIQAFEDHPLKNSENKTIADTTCDNGACSEAESALWVSTLTYGLGFRCQSVMRDDGKNEGSDCIDSSNSDFYKQFSDISSNEIAQSVISGKPDPSEKKNQITLKVNASGTQKPGSYNNTITFIAVPNY